MNQFSNRSFYWIILILVVLMLLSSIPSVAITRFVSGFSLIFHAILAPVLAVCLAGMALCYSYELRFHDEEWQWFFHKTPDHVSGREVIRKLCFWLSLLFAVPVILSITLNMFPLFDSATQTLLASIHRDSVIYLTLTLIIHIFLTLHGGKTEEH